MMQRGVQGLWVARGFLENKGRGCGVMGAGLNMGHAVASDRVCRQNLLTSLSQTPCLPPACAKDSL